MDKELQKYKEQLAQKKAKNPEAFKKLAEKAKKKVIKN